MANRERCCICEKDFPESQLTETLDGFICEDCESLLSPWFMDLDCAETQDLIDQIDDRDQNQLDMADFVPTRKFGEHFKVIVDDETRNFVVAETRDLAEENPDILSIEDVLDCSLDVEETREEIEDELYRYSYTFHMCISMDHPYVDELNFVLNDRSVAFESSEHSFLGFGGFDPENEPLYMQYQELADKITEVLMDEEGEIDRDSRYQVEPGEFNTVLADEEEYEEEDEEEEESPVSHTPKTPTDEIIVCPWCSSKIRMTKDFRCPYCGAQL